MSAGDGGCRPGKVDVGRGRLMSAEDGVFAALFNLLQGLGLVVLIGQHFSCII